MQMVEVEVVEDDGTALPDLMTGHEGGTALAAEMMQPADVAMEEIVEAEGDYDV